MSVEDYEFQLEQVKQVLNTDPENEEVKKLHQDLLQLLELLRNENPVSAKPAVTESPKQKKPTQSLQGRRFLVGEMVLAKFSDGNFYEAMVVTEEIDGEYECVFTGYESIQKLPSKDIREAKEGQARTTLLQSKEVQIGEITSNPKKTMIKKKMKKKEKSNKREMEDQARTAAWQTFQAKNKKAFGGVQKKKEMPKSSAPKTVKQQHRFD